MAGAGTPVKQTTLDGFFRAVPDEDREKFEEFVDALDEGVQKLDDLGEAAQQRDTARLQQLGQEFEELDNRSEQAARDYGLKKCAEDDS